MMSLCVLVICSLLAILYSRKIWWFGSLSRNCQIKLRQYFILAYIIRMAIPYRIAKFKFANTFAMAIWGPTVKFNSHQYSGYIVLQHTFMCGEHAVTGSSQAPLPAFHSCSMNTGKLRIWLPGVRLCSDSVSGRLKGEKGGG